jgi:hypothetical protein
LKEAIIEMLELLVLLDKGVEVSPAIVMPAVRVASATTASAIALSLLSNMSAFKGNYRPSMGGLEDAYSKRFLAHC